MIQENKQVVEHEVFNQLTSWKDRYSPLEILSVKPKQPATDRDSNGRITLGWRGQCVTFLVEIKTRTAPRLINESAWRLKNSVGKRKENLLLIVPFLSKTIVEILEREGMSGLDLNGNYLIQTPELVAIRLDRKNKFTESQRIKKIFSGNSSLVGRLFLSSKRRFESVNAVYVAIQKLGGSLSLSAVSKVLKSLADEMIIEKGNGGIALLQPEKLLQNLQEGYRPPKILGSIKLKLPAGKGLAGAAGMPNLRDTFSGAQWTLTGESSANRYAIMADSSVFKLYIPDFQPFVKFEDNRFYNILIQRTQDSFPYFDVQEERGLRWASPVQSYLELSKLDKREQEVAATVRETILRNLE